jgi:bifunctional ADP-heptose synthase (sugar kinase/adenylyltransferase)
MEMLKALKCVDDVVAYDKLEYVTNCKELDIDIFVIGEDWGDKPHNIKVEKYLKSKGKKIVQVNYDPQTSTTKIKQTIINQSRNRE